MEAVAHNASFAKKVGIPQSVGREFTDDVSEAAGILFSTPDGNALFLKRGGGDHEGEWCLPGGSLEDGETAEEAAQRESDEEIGFRPDGGLKRVSEDDSPEGVRFATFSRVMSKPFVPDLNEEHTEYAWAPMTNPPEPLHPGVAKLLAPVLAKGREDGRFADRNVAESDDETNRAQFFTPTVIGPKRRETPEGFLVCEDVPIARIGEMLYAGHELPELKAARDGLIRIERNSDEVFAADTIASFLGKPVTLDHPSDDVTPENWRNYAVGVVQAVRRGDANNADFLMADLLIQDASAIEAINDGLREVSCGYDADYEQTEPGRGRQLNIIGNHVALVEKGRCGPRCAIQDKEPNMGKRTVWDRLRTAFKAQDAAAFDEDLEEAMTATKDDEEGSEHRIVLELAHPEEKQEDTQDEEEETSTGETKILEMLASISARLDKLEAAEEAETTTDDDMTSEEEKTDDESAEASEEKADEESGEKTKTGDKAKTKDSAALAAEHSDTLARAEILAPGVKLPTFDAKADAKKTVDTMCSLRRKALLAAFKDDDKRDHVKLFVSDAEPDFSKMTCDAVKMIFNGASELAKKANNEAATARSSTSDSSYRDTANYIGGVNKRNAEFWSQSR